MSSFLYTVARLRLYAVVLLLLSAFTKAHEETLFTSSVSYCAPPESLLVQKFNVQYFSSNNSISFNISAESVEHHLNVSANLLLNVYGMHPVNLTIDLCDIAHGALCPLPTYNFTGWDSIPLSNYVDVSGKVPGIAYKVPDLEGYVQLKLLDSKTGETKACVQATLSNGWSTRQHAVEWATGALALVSLAFALWHSFSPDSLIPHRFMDLMSLYQYVAASGLLSLNYPLTYTSFTINFAWALGLFHSESFRSTIDRIRSHTGGSSDDGGGSALALTNRRMSPYNAIAPGILPSPDSSSLGTTLLSHLQPSKRDVATVTSTSDNVLGAGIPVYVTTDYIPYTNAFLTVFFVILIFFAICLGLMLVLVGIYTLILRSRSSKEGRDQKLIVGLPRIIASWWLRWVLIVSTPVFIFAFYQWTLKDSWVSILLSVILFLLVSGFLAFSAFKAFRSRGYTSIPPFHFPLWNQYLPHRYWFFAPIVTASVIRPMIISFGQNHGKAQVITLLIFEILQLAATLILRPHRTRGADVLSSYLAIVRMVSTGLFIAFIEQLHVAAIPRVAIGLVTAVILSIAVVVLFVNLIWHLVEAILPKKASKDSSSSRNSTEASNASMLEKGGPPSA